MEGANQVDEGGKDAGDDHQGEPEIPEQHQGDPRYSQQAERKVAPQLNGYN